MTAMDSELIGNDPQSDGFDVDIWAYLDAIWRRAWIVVIAIVLSVTNTLNTVGSQVPTYTSTVRIQITSSEAQSIDVSQLLLPGQVTSSQTATQLELLTSRAFIETFIARPDVLDQLVPQMLPAASTAAEGNPSGLAAESESGAVVDPVAAPDNRTLKQRMAGLLNSLVGEPEEPGMDASMIPERLRDRRTSAAISRIRSALTVDTVDDTDLVDLSWDDRDPVFATHMANTLAEAFVSYSVETSARRSQQAARVLTEGIERLRDEIREHEASIEAIGGELGMDESGAQSTNSDALDSELTAARVQRIEAEADYRRLQEVDTSNSRAARDAPAARQLRDRLASLQLDSDDLARWVTSAHPQMVELNAQIADAESQLQREEEVAYGAALRQQQQRVDAARDSERRLRSLGFTPIGFRADQYDDLTQYRALQTTLVSKREILEQFTLHRSTLEFAAHLQGNGGPIVEVVDPAIIPRRRGSKGWLRHLFLATLIGSAVGAALALALDFLDNTLRTEEDVQRRLGVPTLRSVRIVGKQGARGKIQDASTVEGHVSPEHVARRQPRSRVAEDYQELRTALLLSSGGGPPRSLLVTSATPGEGKTTTAINLAFSLADAGKRVLLIDADLRLPTIAEALNIGRVDGLSNYLAGTAAWENLILSTHDDRLCVLPSGPQPPNPAELFGTDLPLTLLREAAERFDIVIVDSPPAMSIVDSRILASLVDGVVLVVRANKTPYQVAMKTLAHLRSVHGNVLGVVLNGRAESRVGYGKYDYEYGVDDLARRLEHDEEWGQTTAGAGDDEPANRRDGDDRRRTFGGGDYPATSSPVVVAEGAEQG